VGWTYYHHLRGSGIHLLHGIGLRCSLEGSVLMKSVVYKYQLPLEDGDQHTIKMPKQASIIYVGAQGKTICLWAKIPASLDLEFENRYFQIVGTGMQFDDNFTTQHVGTVQMVVDSEGQHEFVWHIFEQEGF
jgi:hypothetical protein